MNYIPTSDLPRNSPLYWHVRANGTNGPSAWSDFGTYTTGNPPSTPSLLAPPSNTLVGSYTPCWTGLTRLFPREPHSFNHYVLQIADNAGFSNPLMTQNGYWPDLQFQRRSCNCPAIQRHLVLARAGLQHLCRMQFLVLGPHFPDQVEPTCRHRTGWSCDGC